MRFRLKYQGPLGGQNTKDAEKQRIREYFHPQLVSLWENSPLKDYHDYLRFPLPNKPLGFFFKEENIIFCPLVNQRWRLIAKIKFLLLRREPPGNVFSQSGDIDNRIKVLVDSLRMPTKAEIKRAKTQWLPDKPMHCLLQEDKLIDAFSVTTDQLHTAGPSDEVEVIIHVSVRAVYLTLENVALAT